MRRRYFLLIALLMFILTAGIQYLYDSRINYFDTEEIMVNLPDSNKLKIMSIGHDHLLGDLLYIWAIQLYSSYNIANSYDYIDLIFDRITDLIPSYRYPYIVGAMIMAHEKEDTRMAIKLLQKGSKNNPEDWYFDFEAGFYAFQRLKDYKLAEELFKNASEKPEAPVFLRRKIAHMTYMSDDLDKSWALWKDIENNANDDFERQAASNHLYQIKYEADRRIIEKIISAFHKRYNRYPVTLEELIHKGFIKAVPSDYRGETYLYDKNTGRLKARKTFAWKKLL